MKISRKTGSDFLAVAVLAGTLARAPVARAGDIIAFDFNFGTDEVETLVKQVAAENLAGKPTRLILIPPTTPEQRALHRQQDRELKALQREWQVCNRKVLPTSVADLRAHCDTLQARFDKNGADQEALNSQLRLSGAQVAQTVGKVCGGPQKIDRVFMSGHDGTGDFFGTIASLQMNELQALAKKYPSCLGKNVKAAYLWGCYTATPAKELSLWPTVWPNASMVAGYDAMSPASYRPANLATLGGLLKTQDQLIATKDLAKAKDMIKKISGIHWNASVFLSQSCGYYSEGQIGPIADVMRKRCDAVRSKTAAVRVTLNCYWNASPGCTDVPAETESGPLRAAYDHIQINAQCLDAGPPAPNADLTIRLIYYKNVLGNINRVYAPQIARLNAFLKAQGAPSFALPDLSKGDVTRSQMLNWAVGVRTYFSNLRTGGADAKAAQQAAYDLEQRIVNLRCVPFGWVEPNAMVPPAC